MRKILLLFFSLVLVFAARDLRAQERTVSGTVVGSDGAAIPGVTVVAKGTSQGASTDATGKYRFAVPATATSLVFSFVGYDSQETRINQSTINIKLVANLTGLDEVW